MQEFPSSQNRPEEKPLPIGRVNQPLMEYFRENGIESPPVEITILLTKHETSSDAAWIEKYYQDTDIYIPEMVNWTPKGMERYEKVARGDQEAQQIVDTYVTNIKNEPHNIHKGFSIEHMEMIHRHPGKALCVIDLPRDTQLSYKLKQVTMRLGLPVPGVVEEFRRLQGERETQMVLSLPQKLGELFRKNPVITKKDRVKILMYLGYDHGKVSQILEERGENVKSIVNPELDIKS